MGLAHTLFLNKWLLACSLCDYCCGLSFIYNDLLILKLQAHKLQTVYKHNRNLTTFNPLTPSSEAATHPEFVFVKGFLALI